MYLQIPYLTWVFTQYLFHFWICELQVILSGDVELNSEAKLLNLSLELEQHFCGQRFKNFIFSAYNSRHKFEIICLSETYLDCSILPQDLNLEMQGYRLIQTDHPPNVKQGSTCVYYKNHLPLKLLNLNSLQECIIFGLSIKNKFFIIAALYRSPSQLHSEFTNFSTSLELTLQVIASTNPFLSLVLGDFNAKSKVWFNQDNTTTEGTIINDLTQIIMNLLTYLIGHPLVLI